MKRLVTVQDLSCFGKCSLTVALPIISALGIETAVLPTAVLSTHTGKFKNYTYLPLETEMPKIAAHWQNQQITFDAIYIGYVGKTAQLKTVQDFIQNFCTENTLVYIDPAMADGGRLYSGIDENYVPQIQRLCRSADIISPNITEAAMLCGDAPQQSYTAAETEDILRRLLEIYSRVIITGVFIDGKMVTYMGENGKIFSVTHDRENGTFYGTGDIFSSVFVGKYMLTGDFRQSVCDAADFVTDCIKSTLPEKEKYWYGVNFEQNLYKLTQKQQ